MKLFHMAREVLIAVLVCNILLNTMFMNILKWMKWVYDGMLHNLSSQASRK